MHTPWMFPPLDIPFDYLIEHITFGPFMSFLDYLLGLSTGRFHALQLIFLAVFGAVN